MGKYFLIFFNTHCFVCFKNEGNEKKKKRNSTATSSNKNYINDCLKYFAQGINYKECLLFYKTILIMLKIFLFHLILFFQFPFSIVVKTSQLLAN